jgi:hypothetical protein
VLEERNADTDSRQETGMERANWLEAGFDSAQARFLMMTAITHHRFSSPAWGEQEVRKLHAELTEIDVSAAQAIVSGRDFAVDRGGRPAGRYGLVRRTALRGGQEAA